MAARYFEEAAHALAYSKFRPGPPASLISRIVNFLQEKYSGSLNSAIDVGCGSGQSTRPLAKYFANVNGFDVSEAQIKEAIQKNNLNNVSYNNKVDVKKNFFLSEDGVLALYGYYFPHSLWKDKDFHDILISVYENDTKGYWTEERFDVDNGYTDKKYIIPFGECLREDNFFTETKATVRDLEGYITSWSGFQRLKTQKGEEAGQQILNNFVKR
ncbi:putative methyltransferase [Armadillidium vulgare]|nr:putative methyltransferase [Armadillidium vulgare]